MQPCAKLRKMYTIKKVNSDKGKIFTFSTFMRVYLYFYQLSSLTLSSIREKWEFDPHKVVSNIHNLTQQLVHHPSQCIKAESY